MSLDGHGSHVNVTKALEIFAAHNVLVVKEEGDTSHVNQACDQFVAKEDKIHMRTQLNTVRKALGAAMDQWILISIAINAQNQVKKETWIASFRRVSMRPSHRVPFDEWIKILDNRVFLALKNISRREQSFMMLCQHAGIIFLLSVAIKSYLRSETFMPRHARMKWCGRKKTS